MAEESTTRLTRLFTKYIILHFRPRKPLTFRFNRINPMLRAETKLTSVSMITLQQMKTRTDYKRPKSDSQKVGFEH